MSIIIVYSFNDVRQYSGVITKQMWPNFGNWPPNFVQIPIYGHMIFDSLLSHFLSNPDKNLRTSRAPKIWVLSIFK